ncbi:MAG: TerC family protein [Gammaproteobacteria bacterium]|nr:TerC family protein [Gammaproteobacteria bacterium]
METLLRPETWIALITLTALEIVLGIDNIIFLVVMAARLPERQRARARTLGLAGAMITRILLLLSIALLARLTAPLLVLFGSEFSGRDLVLIAGGIFLIAKSTLEIHAQTEGENTPPPAGASAFAAVVLQIAVIDIVFSLDSVITAVGMTKVIGVMVAAIVIAIVIMMLFAGAVSRFVEANPTIKTLALAFLILIGAALVGEGFGTELDKGYIYFAMAFSTAVEVLNTRLRKKRAGSHAQ